jgi:hypothetical protein
MSAMARCAAMLTTRASANDVGGLHQCRRQCGCRQRHQQVGPARRHDLVDEELAHGGQHERSDAAHQHQSHADGQRAPVLTDQPPRFAAHARKLEFRHALSQIPAMIPARAS